MGFSNYIETALCNWLRGNAAMPAQATPYLGLFSEDPTDAGSGAEVTTQIRSGGRLAVTFSSPTDGAMANANEIDFGNSENDVTVTHFGIFDAQSGGNLLVHKALATPKTFDTSDEAKWQAGALSVTVD